MAAADHGSYGPAFNQWIDKMRNPDGITVDPELLLERCAPGTMVFLNVSCKSGEETPEGEFLRKTKLTTPF